MITANLKQTATLETMVQLRDITALNIFAEDPEGRGGGESAPENFRGREGYNPSFLGNWKIPLIMPATQEGKDDMTKLKGGKGVELKYQHFSVIMSASRRMPMLTAVNIDGAQSRKVGRIDKWFYDGRIEKNEQWGNEIYNGNILDRGHMVRREDPNWGTEAQAETANADTFHFTNCCPQVAGVNQKVWLGLENYVLQNAKVEELKVTVFTGPIFSEDDLEYRGARIPGSFWKVVAMVTENNRPSATAYIVRQEKELADLEFVYSAYKTFQVSINHVADQTGLDLEELAQYDGFSQYERDKEKPFQQRLESLDMIRV